MSYPNKKLVESFDLEDNPLKYYFIDKLRAETFRFKKSLTGSVKLGEDLTEVGGLSSSTNIHLSAGEESKDYLHKEFVFQRQLQTQIVSEGKQSELLTGQFEALVHENDEMIAQSITSQKSSIMERLFHRRSQHDGISPELTIGQP